jgi:branched-chain amino acid transport system substrate-binding protein
VRTQRLRSRLLLVLATGLVLALAGCGSGDRPPDGPEPEPVRIAIINPQTGQFSSLGKWEHKGVKLAVDEANAAGGINGRPIELSVFDDQGVAANAAELTDKVAAAGYVAIFGSALSGNTLAMAPSLARFGIPAMTSGQAPSLGALQNPFVFLNCATSTTFDETLAEYVVGTMGMTSIAMITNDGAYGRGERAAFTGALASRGVAPEADVVVAVGQRDFSSALTEIRESTPAALFIGAEELQSGLIAQQARAIGITAMFIGGAPMGTDIFVNTAGAEAVNGSIFTTPYPTNDENDATRAFAYAYQAAFGEAPEFHGAKAYDGARIVIEALRNTDGATGAELAEAIREVRFRGLLGDFSYDATGVGLHRTRVATIDGGRVAAIPS